MSGIAGALAGIHMGIAMLSKQEHWMLSDTEAEAMAQSVVNVARHYPKVASSQKMIDWTMLIGSLGMVYFPRAMKTKELLSEKKKETAHE